MHNLINIWKIQTHNFVNGPGCRFVIWVQGCHLACSGCWNKHTWSFAEQTMMSVDELFDQISTTQGIDGVTFSGGEPFLQAKNLSLLANKVKNDLKINLQVFTGYELSELTKKHQLSLLKYVDIVVAGRFDDTKENNNQKVYELSTHYWDFNNSDVEVEIDNKGDIVITGYPSDGLINVINKATT